MGFLRTFRSHLLWRMICWYFLFLLLPCLLFAGIYFAVNRSYYAEEKRQLEQTALTRCRDEIEESMELCSSVFLQITQHSNFLRFLNGVIPLSPPSWKPTTKSSPACSPTPRPTLL